MSDLTNLIRIGFCSSSLGRKKVTKRSVLCVPPVWLVRMDQVQVAFRDLILVINRGRIRNHGLRD